MREGYAECCERIIERKGSAVILRSVRVRYADLRGYVAAEVRDWHLVRTRGSHRQFKHPGKAGLVTVPGHPSDEVAPGTLNSIFKQAGLKP